MTASTTRRTAAGRSRTAVAAATAVAASLLVLSACGDQTNEAIAKREAKKSRNVNALLFKTLPKDVQEKGFLQVGSDITYKPVEFRSNGRIEGIDPDLAAAMSKELGIKLNFNNATFDTLMGGLKSKRYDIAMSAMTDTKERRGHRQQHRQEDRQGRRLHRLPQRRCLALHPQGQDQRRRRLGNAVRQEDRGAARHGLARPGQGQVEGL